MSVNYIKLIMTISMKNYIIAYYSLICTIFTIFIIINENI